jgi:hypothetical protein
VCREQLYREVVYWMYCAYQGGRIHWRRESILWGVLSLQFYYCKEVFNNYGCRFTFQASEPAETCEIFCRASRRGKNDSRKGLYLYLLLSNVRTVTKMDKEGGVRVGKMSQWCPGQALLTFTMLKQKYVVNMADRGEMSPVAQYKCNEQLYRGTVYRAYWVY